MQTDVGVPVESAYDGLTFEKKEVSKEGKKEGGRKERVTWLVWDKKNE